MMADNAAANRAHNAVMTGIMAGDAAYNCAFQAALRLSGGGPHGGSRDQGEHYGGDRCKSHDGVPLFKSGKSARDLGSAWPLGKVQGEHITWAAPSRAANHCNSDCARL
jgi:hypothetical protein